MINIEARNAAFIAFSAPAMPRFFSFPLHSTRFLRSIRASSVGFSLVCGAICASQGARADEFSALPPNDPIATQLAAISPGARPTSLTRYEAALQTARVILDVQNRDAGTVSRAQWRALAALCGSLKNELRQLGVDVEAARALAAQGLKATEPPAAPKNVLVSPRGSKPNAATAKTTTAKATTARNSSFLTPGLVSPSSRAAGAGESSTAGALEVRPLPRLRVAAEVQRVAGARADAQSGADRFTPSGVQNQVSSETLASQTALSYDLSHYLTLRAANSRLDWNGAAGLASGNPLLGAPFLAGARGASGTGGGVDLSLGAVKFSTEIERLRADTGALASRIGGGASLSAFRDRLSLQMSLSRLLPADKSALPATTAQASASLEVSPRLSLNLRYQGLFAPTPSTSAARVAGGVSLNF